MNGLWISLQQYDKYHMPKKVDTAQYINKATSGYGDEESDNDFKTYTDKNKNRSDNEERSVTDFNKQFDYFEKFRAKLESIGMWVDPSV
jgi:hypothetical protein